VWGSSRVRGWLPMGAVAWNLTSQIHPRSTWNINYPPNPPSNPPLEKTRTRRKSAPRRMPRGNSSNKLPASTRMKCYGCTLARASSRPPPPQRPAARMARLHHRPNEPTRRRSLPKRTKPRRTEPTLPPPTQTPSKNPPETSRLRLPRSPEPPP